VLLAFLIQRLPLLFGESPQLGLNRLALAKVVDGSEDQVLAKDVAHAELVKRVLEHRERSHEPHHPVDVVAGVPFSKSRQERRQTFRRGREPGTRLDELPANAHRRFDDRAGVFQHAPKVSRPVHDFARVLRGGVGPDAQHPARRPGRAPTGVG
jgi:hypothetical protein